MKYTQWVKRLKAITGLGVGKRKRHTGVKGKGHTHGVGPGKPSKPPRKPASQRKVWHRRPKPRRIHLTSKNTGGGVYGHTGSFGKARRPDRRPVTQPAGKGHRHPSKQAGYRRTKA